MKVQRTIFIVLIMSFGLTSSGLLIYRKFFRPKRWNVLILSTCSLSPSRLGFYNPDAHNSLPIDKIAEHSFVFENAITDMSWSNVSGFLSRIPRTHYEKYGYTAIGRPWSSGEAFWQRIKAADVPTYYMRIPIYERSTRNQHTKYREDLKDVKARVMNKKNWPFLLEVHNKTVHMPYLKKSLPKIGAIEMLSQDSRKYIEEYDENMEKYPERIPFSFFVGERGKRHTETVIKILKLDKAIAAELLNNNALPTFVGLLNNVEVLTKWKQSKFFERDMQVIKETYDNAIKIFSRSIEGLVNLYGDKDLADNTVIIFTGDHGEAFFQHGYLVHGETVFDEMIKFPLFIKFPGQTKGRRIKSQFYQQGIAKIVEKIMAGEVNEDNFEEYIARENNHPLIYSRNCANNIKSLRYKNNWKLVENLKNDQRYLYDLVNDPKELKNVYDDHPEITSYLEENISQVADQQLKNKMIHLCVLEHE